MRARAGSAKRGVRAGFQSVFFKLDIWGSLKFAYLPAIVSLMFTDLFDSISTFVGVAHAAKLTNQGGSMVRMKEGLVVDSFATFAAGLFGTSSGTAFIESAAGIEVGGRTGWTSVFTALCFVPCFFLAPLAGSVPAFATTPVLVIVGALMFRSLGELKFDTLEDTVPAFLTIVLIPLTFSITQGILGLRRPRVALRTGGPRTRSEANALLHRRAVGVSHRARALTSADILRRY